ncbi:FxSxx-COOH system tetratricopeptide repeat protein [Micromonospora sp. NBC_01796]|uniref:FxSxx-COOH system tetratricopeptide repeat protein n=1 Tax=Micromonospora sp. NBC_01796 TaxID=2975987 RepID=UPI002DDB7587|nr:FxSxx-COOH system tetratricopeptide repeat protein [Micromonospora sp. NBC_01796]WSA86882.1 FxSxx-COOH system tetratricopeptide repeat protein [Micromonospora sp. NBC_01796]
MNVGPQATPHWDVDAGAALGVQIGDGGFQTNLFVAARPPVTWPCRVGVVPPAADCFQDRPVEAADTDGSVGEPVAGVRVLVGLGGVGKTQVAAQLARHAWREGAVDLLVWITAGSRDSIVAGYAGAAAEVLPGERTGADADADRFLAWLAQTDRRWLIVLDDLSDPADLRGLWPPQPVGGHTLVTTRRRDTALGGSGRRLVEVGLFTPDQATRYLTAKTGRYDEAEQARLLAADLGYLPLALAQAAAYLVDRGLGFADYRRRLVDARRRLPELLPEPGALPDDHRETVAATWALSVELADRLHPPGLARAMLHLLSLLDPNGIPAAVLTTEVALDHLRQARPVEYAGERAVDAEDARDALYGLHRVNLISFDPAQAGRAIRVHGLVQRATREQLTPEQLRRAARTLADALCRTWPEIERESALGQVLRANVETLDGHAGPLLWDPEPHPLLWRAGRSLSESGLGADALTYWQRLHDRAEARLGADHADTLTVRHHLAYALGQGGDPAAAEAAYERLLADRLRVDGPDNRETLVCRGNLANWRGTAGDPWRAAREFGEVLADLLRLLGPDHVDTLNARHNLAFWRGRAGDPAGALVAFEQLLEDLSRVRGPDHPNTLNTRYNVAFWRGLAGDPAGAREASALLLADRLRVLGPDHPSTLTTRYNLARWRGEAGDPAGAVAELEELLVDRIRVLGDDHLHTDRTRTRLAYWRARVGGAPPAVPLVQPKP